MGPITQNGRAGFVRIIALAAFFFTFSFSAFGQTCFANALAPLVHAEGLAEKLGNITLACTGGTAGSLVNTNIFVNLNANVTNRIAADGTLSGISATVTIPPAGALGAGAPPTLYSSQTVAIANLTYTVPTPNTQAVTITIGGIRAAIPTATGLTGTTPGEAIVTASILATGLQVQQGFQAIVPGLGYPSLLDSVISNALPCTTGSPAPATMDFPGLLAAGTAYSAIRITEGYAGAFPPNIPPDPTQDTGVRVLVNLSGYGSNTVYVPDALVGSDGTSPTSAGAFGETFSGGSYSPGQSLLLRVQGANANGVGGSIFLPTPTAATTYTTVSQVTLTNGAGYAVYEVVDGDRALVEDAQIPVFVAVPPNSCTASSPAITLAPEIAPVSTVNVATTADPIPRFIATTPGSDCPVLKDCSAGYFPTLQVNQTPIVLTGTSQGSAQLSNLQVTNSGLGQMAFTVSVTYPAGQTQTSWLTVTPTSGINDALLAIVASPSALPQGQYLATININAGTAGSAAVPLTFNVGAVGTTILSIVNSASEQAGAIAPNSFATIYGANLNGTNVQAIFNGYQATVNYDSFGQVNLLVPAALAGQSRAGVYLLINGVSTNTFPINLTPNAPGIFTPGILNQNNSVNSAAQPASLGDIVQVFLTGFANPIPGPVTVNIGNQLNLPVAYDGAVASINGLEQVNVQIPAALTFTGNSTTLSVCIPGGAQPICTNSVALYMH